MSKYQSKQEIQDEIAHLETKAKHAKSFSEDEDQPKSSRDRFFKKYYEYLENIKTLKKELKKMDGVSSKESKQKFLDGNTIEIDCIEDDFEDEEDIRRSQSSDLLSNSYSDEDDDDDDYDWEDDFREEIDFSDSRRSIDVFNSLYPEGLDD